MILIEGQYSRMVYFAISVFVHVRSMLDIFSDDLQEFNKQREEPGSKR